MTDRTQSALKRATTSTFEELGFLFTDPEVSEEQAEARIAGVARVRFQGPLTGVLELSVAGDILRPLATNMLGVDGAPTPDVQTDALGEVANVICGNVLPVLAGPEAVFELEAPRVRTGTGALASHSDVGARDVRVRVGLQEGWAELRLRVDRDAADQGHP